MNDWIYSKKNNPCPICDRVKDQDCRVHSDGKTVLCHSHLDPQVGETINDYIWTGKENKWIGGSLEHSVWVKKEPKSEPKKIINQPLKKANNNQEKPVAIENNLEPLTITVKAVAVVDEPKVKDISIARFQMEVSSTKNSITYFEYPPDNRIKRIEKPTTDTKRIAAGKDYEKTFLCEHFDGTKWVKGESKNSSIEAYRYLEQKEFINSNEFLLTVEGETNVEASNAVGIAATTFKKWNYENIAKTELVKLSQEKHLTWVVVSDHDISKDNKKTPAQSHSETLQKVCADNKIDVVVLPMAFLVAVAKQLELPLPDTWEPLPNGLDLKDLLDFWDSLTETNLTETNMNEIIQERLVLLLREAISQKRTELEREKPKKNIISTKDGTKSANNDVNNNANSIDNSSAKTKINQKVLTELYSDVPWIVVTGKFYKWVGTHYELVPAGKEEKRIANYLNAYEVEVNNEITYPYATPGAVATCIKWVKMMLSVEPDEINPPGINCINGVLQIEWSEDFKPSWKLVKHDSSKHYYIDAPSFAYDPLANPEQCERLLQALDPGERTIFLRTVAASLDLPKVRQKLGRVKTLICVGDGMNGKDAIRECVYYLHGKGLTACSLTDFQNYDRGRKFGLSRLVSSRFNWSSENSLSGKLDQVQCLKNIVSGESVSCEPKGKDETEFNPRCVLMFNVNELPKIQGHQAAFLSRYGILKFNKTFKRNANTAAGELEAEPRFKYDPIFIKTQVMPAFLNKVLEELKNLMEVGINYDHIDEAMNEARASTNHLYLACKDLNIVASKGSEIPLKEVWTALYGWYLSNGYVTEETDKNGKVKQVWTNEVDQSDKLIKAPRTVLAGLRTVFGNAVKSKTGKGNLTFLTGIEIKSDFAYLVNPKDSEPLPDIDSSPNNLVNPFDNLPNPSENLVNLQVLEPLPNNNSSATVPEISPNSCSEILLNPSEDDGFKPIDAYEDETEQELTPEIPKSEIKLTSEDIEPVTPVKEAAVPAPAKTKFDVGERVMYSPNGKKPVEAKIAEALKDNSYRITLKGHSSPLPSPIDAVYLSPILRN